MSSPTLELTMDLIRRQSVTPEDADCQAMMIERLSALGFKVENLPFEEVTNFWATRGEGEPVLAFAGHTDVVPTGPLEQWHSDPFQPEIRDGILYGRGAADMKGSLAAMITACEGFINANPDHKGTIAFLITSDEEGPAKNGTKKVVEHLQNTGRHIDWCVVGEPSSQDQLGDTVKNGRRGSLGGLLRVHGHQGHIAYPHLATNPIHEAVPALTELTHTLWDHGNQFFPATSFQISNFNSGTGAGNVIPGHADVHFNFRFSTEVTADILRQRTHEILDKHGLEYDLDWTLYGEPFLTEPASLTNATVAAIRSVTGVETKLSTSGGTSDGRFIAPMGTQVIELGPCNASIHKVNEHVCASDLDQLSDIYAGILQRLML